MVHGGLRYLQNGDVRLVYEALAERQRLRRNAPHLVKILPFLIPIFSKDGFINPKVARAFGSAMWMYDVTGGARIGKLHKRLKPAEALEYMPTLPAERLAGGVPLLRRPRRRRPPHAHASPAPPRSTSTPSSPTAAVSRSCSRTDSDGRVAGATIDADGNTFDVRRRVRRQRHRRVGGRRARPRRRLASRTRCVRRRASTSRCRGRRCATRSRSSCPCRRTSARCSSCRGPTTRASRSSPTSARPTPTTRAASTIRNAIARTSSTSCGAINGSVTSKLTDDDVLGTWAGLRPLVKSASSGRTADLSRRHRVARSASGVVTITGGKLTTYREMAADTVDEVVRELGDGGDHAAAVDRARRHLQLRGADGYDTLSVEAAAAGDDDADSTCSTGTATRRPPCSRWPNAIPALAEPLVPGLPYLRAEAVYAARHEMARSVDDVLSRRTRARLLARDETAAHRRRRRRAPRRRARLGRQPSRPRRSAAYRAGVDARAHRPRPPRDRARSRPRHLTRASAN